MVLSLSRNLIRQARQTDLGEYLLSRGEPLRKDGPRRYRHTKHTSLVITGNAFYWNSRSEHGNAIDFLMLYYQMDFKSALEELTNRRIDIKKEPASAPNAPQALNSAIDFTMPVINKDMRRVFAYLIKTRNIAPWIVQKLAKEHRLLQDQRGNAVFPWLNEHDSIVGAELHGTNTEKRFKNILAGSQYGYGFNISLEDPNAIYFFESAIDLLSFWSLNPSLGRCVMVSMAGLKWEVVEGFLSRLGGSPEVKLCADNDQAGKDFSDAVRTKIEATTIFPPNGKDWNQYLKSNTARA